MDGRRALWTKGLKAIATDYDVARSAIGRFADAAPSLPLHLRDNLEIGDVHRAAENLEGTYLIRLFAEFETGLRSFWRSERDTEPRVRDLVDGVASGQRIHPHLVVAVHQVRIYRNLLVHQRDEEDDPITLSAARTALGRFFAFLPPDW